MPTEKVPQIHKKMRRFYCTKPWACQPHQKHNENSALTGVQSLGFFKYWQVFGLVQLHKQKCLTANRKYSSTSLNGKKNALLHIVPAKGLPAHTKYNITAPLRRELLDFGFILGRYLARSNKHN